MTMADRARALLKSPVTALVTALISIGALAQSWQANAIATREAEARAAAIEAQNVRLQNAFCGLVQPFGEQSQPTTPNGARLRESFQNAGRQLGCTPDPFDGR